MVQYLAEIERQIKPNQGKSLPKLSLHIVYTKCNLLFNSQFLFNDTSKSIPPQKGNPASSKELGNLVDQYNDSLAHMGQVDYQLNML